MLETDGAYGKMLIIQYACTVSVRGYLRICLLYDWTLLDVHPTNR